MSEILFHFGLAIVRFFVGLYEVFGFLFEADFSLTNGLLSSETLAAVRQKKATLSVVSVHIPRKEHDMTLILELPVEVEGALTDEAQRRGVTPEQLVLEGLRQQYPSPARSLPPADAMTALFAQWDAEDTVTGPEDLAARQREGDELMAALQANRFNLEGRTDFRSFVE